MTRQVQRKSDIKLKISHFAIIHYIIFVTILPNPFTFHQFSDFVSTYLKLLSRSRKRESQLQKHLTHAHQVCKENDENLICEINGKN